ncbi:group I truncated hemoglobin [Gilvimarinus japonicus]|jgi:hemoglobin|uniref:Group 1 truncated hemoglobin n=1 Tax=Gilvimarinus japonicus TaxID=1796469 RepID=A0ABV7HJE7_9GAMM
MKLRNICVAAVLSFSVIGCTLSSQNISLYDRLGGESGVDAIVYQLLVNISQDPRVFERFNGVDIEKFRAGFAQYICSVSGGDCEYQGDNMQQVHAGHDYTDTEFNAIVGNLIQAMEHEGVPTRTQNALLRRLAPSYKDVVYQ